jgi:hypothetical protein
MTHYLALTCEALARSLYSAAADSSNTISIRLFRQGLHNTPKNLRAVLQDEINAVEAEKYDAVLLAYGICGTATFGLTSDHTQLVIPRAHDCITLYLGSHQRYQEEFNRHPGTYWYSVDYIERNDDGASVALGAAGIEEQENQYEEYVRKYGVENADLLMETMRGWMQHYSRAVFIDTGLGENEPYEKVAREKAENEGWVFERLQGNRRLVEMLVRGDWNEDEFLVVPPGHTIQQSVQDGLLKSVPA